MQKYVGIALLVVCLTPYFLNAYILKSDVLSSGGTEMVSSSYILKGTLSQMTASSPWLTSSGYRAIIGFWHPYPLTKIREKFMEKVKFPLCFYLYPCSPNPATEFVTIRYSIARRSNVLLELYNPLGQKVATLINEMQEPGNYKVTWKIQKGEIPAGVYFYRFKAGDYEKIRKMVILKK